MKEYDFSAAITFCETAINAMDSTDVSLEAANMKLLQAQNALSMTAFCSSPKAIARRTLHVSDFFLYYPLPDRTWRQLPNQLDTLGGEGFSRAVYVSDGAKEIYFSAPDADGIRNIYKTEFADTVWTAPALINETLTSSGDEIYPMVSPDGKSLYFASKGLYGMGGYDIYVSQWDEENGDWGAPVNMGFPYSSPYDDFLFVNSADGRFSVFASNRGCAKDSVTVYVLEYDGMPIRTSISGKEKLRGLCELRPQAEEESHESHGSSHGETDSELDEAMKRYSDKLLEVRNMRDSVRLFNENMDALRAKYAEAGAEEKAALAQELTSKEIELPALNKRLAAVVQELQAIEMDFLSNGIMLDANALQEEADKDFSEVTHFEFIKNSFGKKLQINILKPEPVFDYTFKILSEGQFALDNTLPDGLIYQIRFASLTRKATINDLKGLSPVFEQRNSSGRYVYSVGLFRSYDDALSNLNKVKRAGFRDALITAFNDGKTLTVNKARALEKETVELCSVKIFPDNGASLPEGAIDIIRSHTSKDLIKSVDSAGAIYFMVGPFDSRSAADGLASALRNLGISNVSVE